MISPVLRLEFGIWSRSRAARFRAAQFRAAQFRPARFSAGVRYVAYYTSL